MIICEKCANFSNCECVPYDVECDKNFKEKVGVGDITDKDVIGFLNNLEDKSQLVCKINTVTCTPLGLPPKIERKKVTVADIVDILNRQQAEIERLKKVNDSFTDIGKLYSEIKADATKEVVGKVRRYIKSYCNPYGKPTLDYDTSLKIMYFIDNLVKESEVNQNE